MRTYVRDRRARPPHCGRCGVAKTLEHFAWRRKHKVQRDNYCRPCRSDYKREHCLAHKPRYVDQARAQRQQLATERDGYLLGLFATNPCADCGETDPLALEFDHLRDKCFNIGSALPYRNWESILAEIAKCARSSARTAIDGAHADGAARSACS